MNLRNTQFTVDPGIPWSKSLENMVRKAALIFGDGDLLGPDRFIVSNHDTGEKHLLGNTTLGPGWIYVEIYYPNLVRVAEKSIHHKNREGCTKTAIGAELLPYIIGHEFEHVRQFREDPEACRDEDLLEILDEDAHNAGDAFVKTFWKNYRLDNIEALKVFFRDGSQGALYKYKDVVITNINDYIQVVKEAEDEDWGNSIDVDSETPLCDQRFNKPVGEMVDRVFAEGAAKRTPPPPASPITPPPPAAEVAAPTVPPPPPETTAPPVNTATVVTQDEGTFPDPVIPPPPTRGYANEYFNEVGVALNVPEPPPALTENAYQPESPTQDFNEGVTIELGGFHSPVFREFILKLHNHIFSKCGWDGHGNFTAPGAIVELVPLTKNEEQFITGMNAVNEQGRWMNNAPVTNGIRGSGIRGHLFGNLPGYEFFVKVKGVGIQRFALIPQNPNKLGAGGQLKWTAQAARNGVKMAWLIQKGNPDRWVAKISDKPNEDPYLVLNKNR